MWCRELFYTAKKKKKILLLVHQDDDDDNIYEACTVVRVYVVRARVTDNTHTRALIKLNTMRTRSDGQTHARATGCDCSDPVAAVSV